MGFLPTVTTHPSVLESVKLGNICVRHMNKFKVRLKVSYPAAQFFLLFIIVTLTEVFTGLLQCLGVIRK